MSLMMSYTYQNKSGELSGSTCISQYDEYCTNLVEYKVLSPCQVMTLLTKRTIHMMFHPIKDCATSLVFHRALTFDFTKG